jgi:hypothetical protein
MKCSVIVPAFNEENRIADCLSELLSCLPEDYKIIVAADGCTDRTVEIAKQFPVKIATFSERLGKGGGILNALEMAEGEAILIMDADLSVLPNQIPKIVKELENVDIVLGSRNLEESKILVKAPFHRKLLGKAFNWLFRRLFGIKLFDTQCGFKAIKEKVLEDLENDLCIEGFAFDVDLVVKANKKGYKIKEIPIEWSYKKGSKVNALRQVYTMGKDLLMIWLETKKKEIEVPNLRGFYSLIEGDVYEKASKSWFLPRRLWHWHKNKKIAEKVDGERILDAGCGSGTMLKFLKGKNVVGIDIGKNFLTFCCRNYGGDFICADIQNLPFKEKSFDTIICSEVLEHVENPEKALRDFNRVGENVILTTPNISFRWALIEAIWTRIRGKMLETKHKAFTRRRLRYLMQKTGFEIQCNAEFMFDCLVMLQGKAIKVKN